MPGLPHHLTRPGNNRQDLFFVDSDRIFHLETLHEQCEKQGVRVLGYCLMTNHVHLRRFRFASASFCGMQA